MQAGKTLAFGDLGANREGLTHPRNTPLPWELVSRAEVEKGTLVIESRLLTRPFCMLALYDAPNLHLLIALVEHHRPS